MKKIYLFLIFIHAVFTSNAQTQKLSGTVKDERTTNGLAYASVAIIGSNENVLDGAMTDKKGAFALKNLSPGTYTLRIKFIGYHQKDTLIQMNQNRALNLGDLFLRSSSQEIAGIQITGRTSNQQQLLDRQVYQANQFKNAVGGTALDIVKNLPSASIDGNGNISMRGQTGIIVLVNGKPSLLDPVTMLNQIAANDVLDVEYISNPQSNFDPDGKAGMINLVTKKGTNEGLAWVLNLQGGLPSIDDYDNVKTQQRYGGDISFQYNNNKLSLQGSANYLRNDNAGFRDGDVYSIIQNKQTFYPSQGERSFDKYNYAARLNLGYKFSESNVLNLGVLASRKYQDRVADIHYKNRSIDINTGEQLHSLTYFNPNLQNKQGEFYLIDLSYEFALNKNHGFKVGSIYEIANIYGSTNNGNIANQSDTVQWARNIYRNPLAGYRLSLDYNWNLGKGKFQSGYQYRQDSQEGEFDYYQSENGLQNLYIVPEFTGKLDASNRVHALYSQYGATRENIEYSLGLRYEYYQRDVLLIHSKEEFPYQTHQFYPNITFKQKLNQDWSWRFAGSRRVQRNNNFELNPIPEREHSETLERGDPELLPEFVTNMELGVIKKFKAGNFFTNAYYQHSKNPLQRVNSVYADTILHRVFTNADYAERWGLEFGGEWKPIQALKFSLGANVYNYRISGQVLDYPNPQTNKDWVYSFNSSVQADLKNNWSAGLQVNYLSERPTVQGFDSRFIYPNMNLSKGFMKGLMKVQLQWQFIELGNWGVNEQRITTSAPDFYTTTNYIYEKNVLLLNLNVNLNKLGDFIKLPKSEFGEKEF